MCCMFAALLILKAGFNLLKQKNIYQSKSKFIIVFMESKKYHKQIYSDSLALLELHLL